MCGIAGIVGRFDPRQAEPCIQRMLQTLERRGPDAAGVESWPQAIFGHRRLAIYDLSTAGIQPMLTPDRRVGVVFNGAIYNFLTLRTELEQAGYRFRSRTDTEILLYGYQHWGIHRLVKRLRGMFAIALWDEQERVLYLIRDRLGVKPLYYALVDGCLVFGSTAQALQASGFAGSIDPQAVAEFLEFGYVTDERSIYSQVRKVQAGTILEWRHGRLSEHRYWSVPSPEPQRKHQISFEDAVAETERLLLEAVAIRLTADVQIGALLSAGIDSSLVCWAMAQHGAPVTAFTVSTPGEELDESAAARQTAQQLGLRHEVVPMSRTFSVDPDELTRAWGEPFACASALGMLRLSETIRGMGVTVLLTGDGGDDVFLGYPEHRIFYQAQRLAAFLPTAFAQRWERWRRILPQEGLCKRAGNFLAFATGGLRGVTDAHLGLPYFRQAGLLGPRLGEVSVSWQQTPWSPESARRLLSDFLDYEHRTRFRGEYMTKIDGGTMHYALEARSPFLDHLLWEFAAQLPYEIRLHGGRLKAILRALAERHLGRRVSRRPKSGFGIPVGRWLAGHWRVEVEQLLADSVAARQGWLNGPALQHAFRQAADRGYVPNPLWYAVVFEKWLRQAGV